MSQDNLTDLDVDKAGSSELDGTFWLSHESATDLAPKGEEQRVLAPSSGGSTTGTNHTSLQGICSSREIRNK